MSNTDESQRVSIGGQEARALDEQREIHFECPVCKRNRLYIEQFDFTEVTHLYSGGEIELGDEFPEEDLGFECQGCGHELRDNHVPVVNRRELVGCVLKNCPQPIDDVPMKQEQPQTNT